MYNPLDVITGLGSEKFPHEERAEVIDFVRLPEIEAGNDLLGQAAEAVEAAFPEETAQPEEASPAPAEETPTEVADLAEKRRNLATASLNGARYHELKDEEYEQYLRDLRSFIAGTAKETRPRRAA